MGLRMTDKNQQFGKEVEALVERYYGKDAVFVVITGLPEGMTSLWNACPQTAHYMLEEVLEELETRLAAEEAKQIPDKEKH